LSPVCEEYELSVKEAIVNNSSVFYDYETPAEIFLQAVMERAHDRVLNLLSTGISVESVDRAGTTGLFKAALWGYTDMVQLLLSAFASVHASDRWGPALLRSSHDGYLQLVVCLIAAGAVIDAVDEEGYTALMYASGQGRSTIVRLLLEAGACEILVNIKGQTAEDMAHPECRSVLVALREQALLKAFLSS
jgi:ankyrin repeat protein